MPTFLKGSVHQQDKLLGCDNSFDVRKLKGSCLWFVICSWMQIWIVFVWLLRLASCPLTWKSSNMEYLWFNAKWPAVCLCSQMKVVCLESVIHMCACPGSAQALGHLASLLWCDTLTKARHCLEEKYLGGECKAVSCTGGLTNNGHHLGTVGGSLRNSLLRTSRGCWKNGQEKRKGGKKKITFNTMENRQFCVFVGSDTMGGQMWTLHKIWAIARSQKPLSPPVTSRHRVELEENLSVCVFTALRTKHKPDL